MKAILRQTVFHLKTRPQLPLTRSYRPRYLSTPLGSFVTLATLLSRFKPRWREYLSVLEVKLQKKESFKDLCVDCRHLEWIQKTRRILLVN